MTYLCKYDIFNKYKTFSVLIYSYINTSGNWENEKLCGNTTPEGQSVFTQCRVFPISTSVDITLYQYEKMFYIYEKMFYIYVLSRTRLVAQQERLLAGYIISKTKLLLWWGSSSE